MPIDLDDTDQEIDFDGVIPLPLMCRLLQKSDDAIRRRLREGTFPVPPLRGIDHPISWWGPTVKRWLDGLDHPRGEARP